MHFKTLPVLIGFVLLVVAVPNVSPGQIRLTGMVADSATMEPLPNVNLVSKKTGKGTVSDIRGSFSMQVSAGDSIVFSRVGYRTKTLAAAEVKELVIIFLKEERRMLGTVEIIDTTRLSWLPKIEPESPWQNRASGRRFSEAPGFRGVETFGPGYVFKGVFSRMSKGEKEKRKLAVVKEENYRASDYVNIVNDPNVKGKIMKDYSLTEEEYYDLLARFNQTHGNSIYGLENHEIVALLVKFFARQQEKY